MKAVKTILIYLKGTQNVVLFYPARDSFNLVVFADNNYVGYFVDRISTFGMAHFLGPCLV